MVCLKITLKFILIVGVIIVCSIIALTIGLSIDKIITNQNNLEIEKEDLENVLKQDKLLSKTNGYLTDPTVSVTFSNYLDAFSASRSIEIKLKNPGNFKFT